jgi:phytoene dehydrogenase-like protein
MDAMDVIVIGAGHNGLAAAILLARSGLSVCVVEDKPVTGGAARVEFPFQKAPKVPAQTGAYLIGLVPPELLTRLGVTLDTKPRPRQRILPTTQKGQLVSFGPDLSRTKQDIEQAFSTADATAWEVMTRELSELRADIAPSWLAEPETIEATAERRVRGANRKAFIELCRGSVATYLGRFGWKSEHLMGLFATDGIHGSSVDYDAPGSGMTFLVQHMGRLPGGEGSFVEIAGGVGAFTRQLVQAAEKAGVVVQTGKAVAQILVTGNSVTGVLLTDGSELSATTVLSGADPLRTRALVGADKLPAEYNKRLDALTRDGATLKLNVALAGEPGWSCLPEGQVAGSATVSILPDGPDVMAALRTARKQMAEGALPDAPPIEWTTTTLPDGTGKDVLTASVMVHGVPYDLQGTTWAASEESFASKVLTLCEKYAPGLSARIVDVAALHPKKLETHFGISRGHIQHVDNSFGFSDRAPYRTPIGGLYACGAGCHPAGNVIGAAGHNAATRVLADMEASLETTEVQAL